jgi:hypothetical protein
VLFRLWFDDAVLELGERVAGELFDEWYYGVENMVYWRAEVSV